MSIFLSIRALYEDGVAKKAIARRLGVDPRTVRKYIRRIEIGEQSPTRAPVAKKLDELGNRIDGMVEKGLSGVQIYQELCKAEDFDASYPTVQRLVRRLRRTDPEVYCRMRYVPGEEAQVDFGEVGRVPLGGKRRKVFLFVMTLCYSRYAYYELVREQSVPTFLGAIRRALQYFGGSPKRLKPDNLRAAVLIDQLGQRYYQEDFFRFCRHYGIVPDAARPHTPTDKGRTERDIGYAKGNFFRGRTLAGFEETNRKLAQWREEVANVRVHGTTRRRPVDLFETERAALRPLPEEPYEVCRWGRYKVRKDCHIHVQGNYYSVPYRLVGTWVLVRLSEDKLTVFADHEPVASHKRLDGKGGQVTEPSHYPETKRTSSQEIHRRRVQAVREAGPHAAQYLSELRGGTYVYGDQLARMAGLVASWGQEAVEKACRRALFFGATDGARIIERILRQELHLKPLPIDESSAPAKPLPEGDYGRPLIEYDALLSAAM